MALQARDLMTPQPLTLRPDTPFLEIQHLFIEARIGGAPVVDEHGGVRGIVTATDLLTVVDQVCDEDDDAADDAEALAERLDAMTASDIATPEVAWVAPDADVAEIAHRMHHEGLHHVLVGTDHNLLGVLTAFDLLRAVRS